MGAEVRPQEAPLRLLVGLVVSRIPPPTYCAVDISTRPERSERSGRLQQRLIMLQLVATLCGAVDSDRVQSLPGYRGTLPNTHYSGYVETPLPSGAGTAHTHYWLVLSGRADAPTVVWQQGGPGGSSLIGLLTENGPLTLNDASFSTKEYNATGVPTVFDNPHAWINAEGSPNMLYVEHPAPTGFSYCGSIGTDCVHDDETQSQLNYDFYVKFFSLYPELADKPLFYTGESYAGVLVPTLALKLLAARNATNRHTAPWSITGFALGASSEIRTRNLLIPRSSWAS